MPPFLTYDEKNNALYVRAREVRLSPDTLTIPINSSFSLLIDLDFETDTLFLAGVDISDLREFLRTIGLGDVDWENGEILLQNNTKEAERIFRVVQETIEALLNLDLEDFKDRPEAA